MSYTSKNRTNNYMLQLKASFVFKFLSMLISFALIPVMIRYLGPEKYGIWSTLLSIVSWILMFDLGVGNGLRNKISESLAKNNKFEARKYISTAYVSIGFVAVIVWLLFIIISQFIPWQMVFNSSVLSERDLTLSVCATLTFLFVNFFLTLINQVANGIQKSQVSIFNQFFSNSLSLFFVWLLSLYTSGSILYLSIFYGFSLCLSSLVISVCFYRINSSLKPTFYLFDKSYIYPIISLGTKFLVIQIAVIILFATDKIVIAQLFGAGFVVQYDVVFKLFSVITILQGILLAPLWGAYSDAYFRKDFIWLRYMMKKQLKIYMLIVLAVCILVLSVDYILKVWIGDDVKSNSNLTIMMGCFVLFSCWNSIFAVFVNGLNKLRLQLVTSLLASVVNIPLSIFFVKVYGMGIEGVILGSIVSLSFFAFTGPVQVYRVLRFSKKYQVSSDVS